MEKITCPRCGHKYLGPRRYSLEPLALHIQATVPAACRLLGLSGSTEKDARCHGLTRTMVEKAAGLLHEHPSTIWPEVYEHDIEDTLLLCAHPRCEQRFLPRNRIQKYCSDRCQRRDASRRRMKRLYDSDPEFRAQRVAMARQYRKDCRKAISITKKRHREKNREHLIEKDRAYYWANREAILVKQRARDAARRGKKEEAA